MFGSKMGLFQKVVDLSFPTLVQVHCFLAKEHAKSTTFMPGTDSGNMERDTYLFGTGHI